MARAGCAESKSGRTGGVDEMTEKKDPSQDYIAYICSLYGDVYDDRLENSAPPARGMAHREIKEDPGEDWIPGMQAQHKSLSSFQKELKDVHGIKLSTAKIRKILITGGCWSTERSREVADLYEKYHSIPRVAAVLNVSDAYVTMILPYERVVYDLDDKSANARRIERLRKYASSLLSQPSDISSNPTDEVEKTGAETSGEVQNRKQGAQGADARKENS